MGGRGKIVDDPIENAYLEDLEDMIAGEDPETPLVDFDVTKGLAKFIKKNIDDRTVTGWDGQQEGRKMKITKRQLRKIINEEKKGLSANRRFRSKLRRIIREQLVAEEEQTEEKGRTGASTGALKKWLVTQATGAADLGVPGGQVPSLIAAMESLIAAAASGKLKSKEAYLTGQISKVGGV
jgi:hypothetical protein